MGRKFTDLTGQKFNRLKVIEYSHTNKHGAYWKCLCDCGKEIIVLGSYLRNGDTKSCGCLKREVASKNRKGKNNHKWNPNREEVMLNAKISNAMYNLLRNTLKRTGTIKTSGSEIMQGYKRQDLEDYMIPKFIPGMSWQNHGEWHIDHIKPISAFLKEGITDPKIINALSNLQPLWAEDNLKKGSYY